MCFSAEASFTLGGVLLIAGAASLAKVRKPRQLLFAGMPLIFGIQQLTEGFLWLSLMNPEQESWKAPATCTFLFFAQVLWPAWVPLSFYLLEEDARRKRILLGLLLTGVVMSVYLAYCLFRYPVEASVISHHIHYRQDYPEQLKWMGALFYFLATVIPPFISGIRGARLIGICLLGSFIISKVLFQDHVVSVWCFLAAAVSMLVFLQMRKGQRSNR